MSDTFKGLSFPSSLQGPVASVPLRGYVVEEDEGRLWIQDREGTWAVRREDIVVTQDWKGSDPRFRGKPTCVFIREGAEILEVRPYRVKLSRLPLTLNQPDAHPSEVGEQQMRSLEGRMARHLGFFNEVDPGPLVLIGTTVCCYTNPHGLGLICEGDDCGPIVP